MEIATRKRKIIRGSYSYFMSLPMEWVTSMKLEEGRLLLPLILENGDLLVRIVEEKNEITPTIRTTTPKGITSGGSIFGVFRK